MGYYPRETIIEPGYIVDVCYRDDNPPAEVLSSECTYYPGYYDVTITVTCDNLSVAQRTQKVFLVATHDPEEHGTLVHAAGTTLPLGNEHRVAHVVFGKKSLNLGGRPVDYDITFSFSTIVRTCCMGVPGSCLPTTKKTCSSLRQADVSKAAPHTLAGAPHLRLTATRSFRTLF